MKAWETFVDVGLLLVQSLRHLLVRVRLDAQRLLDREYLEEEWEVPLCGALVTETLGDGRADEL